MSDSMSEDLADSIRLIQSGDAGGALRSLSRVVDRDPDNLDALMALAAVAASQNDLFAASRHISALLERAPTHGTAFEFAVHLSFQTKDWELGIGACKRYLAHGGTNPNASPALVQLLECRHEDLLSQRRGAISEVLEDSLLRYLSEVERRENRPVVLRSLYCSAFGNFALSFDLLMRRQAHPELRLTDPFSSCVQLFACDVPPNRQLLSMFKRYMPILESTELVQLISTSERFRNSRFYAPQLTNYSNEFAVYEKTRAWLEFTEEELNRGRDGLRRMGIPDGSWFVTIFARDAAYKQYQYPTMDFLSVEGHRNADIETYYPAIEEIVRRGGYVVRMGSKVTKPLGFDHPRVIDYATKHHSDFMDIYLIAKSRFVLGTSSGIVDLSYLFDVPRLNVNHTPVGAIGFGPGTVYVPKRVRTLQTNRPASYQELVRRYRGHGYPAFYNGELFMKDGFYYEDNSADEILAATKEMFERLEGTFVESEEYKRLSAELDAMLPTDHLSYGYRVPMSSSFLLANKDYFFGRSA
jgi:putative glycosyltransferase (TIGR04372 family)